MSVLEKFIKQPGETESYTISYADDLTDGDGVISIASSVSPTGLSIDSTNHDLTSMRIWLSGGTANVKYKVEVTATTGDGRVLQDEFYVTVRER